MITKMIELIWGIIIFWILFSVFILWIICANSSRLSNTEEWHRIMAYLKKADRKAGYKE